MEWTRGRTIGRGSTATVSIATADQSGHVFAVKSAELSQSESLRREQMILSTLRCPHVVAYKGCDISSENGKVLYNVFLEYAPSGTIMDAIQRSSGCLDEATVRSYTRGILLGLEYLHSSGIVHCDIKSQNVLVTDDGVIKIADLGCARGADVVSSAAWSVAGTPVYMAPEVARGEQQGFPADVWALGCTVIEMTTGRGPWPDVGDPVSALYRIGFSSDVPETPSNLSKQAMDFLSKCLRRDPDERWSATELLEHEFVKGSKFPATKTDGSDLDTPNSVLHRHLWDSMEELETIQIASRKFCSTNRPLMERVEQLGDDDFALKMPNWEWDENWLTVRSNSYVEVEMSPSRQDHNHLHVDEPASICAGDMSRMSKDYDLPLDYYRTQISRKNICIKVNYILCKYMIYISCIKMNYSNDKCVFKAFDSDIMLSCNGLILRKFKVEWLGIRGESWCSSCINARVYQYYEFWFFLA